MNISKINTKNIIKTAKILKNMYEIVRVVDPVQNTVINITKKSAVVSVYEDACYAFWKKGAMCDNCSSLRAVTEKDTFLKFEVVDKHIYMITAIPVEYRGGLYAMELLSDITGKGILENIAGKETKDIAGFVLQLNAALVHNEKLKKIRIQNDGELEPLQKVIDKLLKWNISSAAIMFEVAVNEAISNGLRAGGRVYVKIRRLNGRLIIRVKDDGPGFSTGAVNAQLKKVMTEESFDAEFDEMRLAESGRGILLMKLLCDRLIYNAKGNEVLLMKKL